MKLHEMKWGVTDHVVGVRGAKRERGSNDGGRVERERKRGRPSSQSKRKREREKDQDTGRGAKTT